MICLGLDVGSSTIKGAVLDLDRNQLGAIATRPFPALIAGRPSGWFEVSPVEIEQEVRRVLEMLLTEAPEAVSLFFAGQMGGLLLVDDSGSPLTNYHSWRDQRTLEAYREGHSYLQEVRQRWEGRILQSLGNELQPGSAAAQLFWLARHNCLPDRAILATVADFVIGRLCRTPSRMHVTHAIGMLELQTSTWHDEALGRLEIEPVRRPDLSGGIEPIGEVRILGTTLPVFGAYGDQQCALLGAGLRHKELSINVSTGSQVSQLVSRFEPGRYQTRRFFDNHWLNTVTHLPAGRSLNVLVDLLSELAVAEGISLRDPWGTIVQKADLVAATDLDVDLAFFTGPLGTAGCIRQITTENLTVGHLFHAAFRAMADNYARCATWLDPHQKYESVVLSGGLTKAVPRLHRMIAERFDVPIRESAGEETLLGLLELARIGNGVSRPRGTAS